MEPICKRINLCLDEGWRFSPKNIPAGEDPALEDSDWRTVNLPHDFSIEGDYDPANPSGGSGGFLPTGTVWYRKTLSIPPKWQGKKIFLLFDGVFCNSSVYAEGVRVGGIPYGWLSFSCDITEALRGKSQGVIAVKADNSKQPAARWYTGTGIYSHVHLLVTDPLHVAEHGVHIITPAEEKQAPDGRITVKTTLKNEGDTPASVTLHTEIAEKATGRIVASLPSVDLSVAPHGERTSLGQGSVENPRLWSPEEPHLYEIVTRIVREGEVLDHCTTPFGFRGISWDEEGFYLNGAPMKLRGVANHWALGALGAAQSTNMIRYKIQMMKDMGVNCIRTAHNACPPEFYDLCDEMGMGVMDELFEGESGKAAGDYGTLYFKEHWKTDVESWVRRDRNHPCVLVWSIGNETGSRNDNTGICPYIKNFDTTRPVTGSWIFTGVDIPGANGVSEQKSFEKPMEGLPLIATEAPHTHGVRGVYRTQTWFRGSNVAGGNRFEIPNLTEEEIFRYDRAPMKDPKRMWVSSYDNGVSQISVRKHWTLTRDLPWRLGEFRWTGFDYLGEANYVLGGWPYRMFHSGAVDSALFPKDMYYLYQSLWIEEPMLHILPSWTHPTVKEGTEIPLWVYSNCPQAELFLNGRSLGKINRGPVASRPWDKIQFDWLVPYEEGTLTAVGYDEEGKVLLKKTVKTAEEPAKIRLENTTGETLPNSPFWVGQVTASLTDRQGTLCPYGENRLFFRLFGPARLKALDNGNPTDTENHTNHHRKAFMGLCKVFLTPQKEEGDIQLLAGGILGEKHLEFSRRITVCTEQLTLRGNPKEKEYSVFYTLDGSLPTRQSRPYKGPFDLREAATVRAALFVEGEEEPILLMEEAFGPGEGMCLDHSVCDPSQEEDTPTFRIVPSCRPSLCLGVSADGTARSARPTENTDTLWRLETNVRGMLFLIHTKTGKRLAADGERIFLTEDEKDPNARWLRMGEMENFDYLIHSPTEKALSVTEEGELYLSDRDFHDPADRKNNLSYWLIQRES